MAENLNTMIKNVLSGDLAAANTEFEAVMSARINTALDQQKVAIAGSIGQTSPEQSDDDE